MMSEVKTNAMLTAFTGLVFCLKIVFFLFNCNNPRRLLGTGAVEAPAAAPGSVSHTWGAATRGRWHTVRCNRRGFCVCTGLILQYFGKEPEVGEGRDLGHLRRNKCRKTEVWMGEKALFKILKPKDSYLADWASEPSCWKDLPGICVSIHMTSNNSYPSCSIKTEAGWGHWSCSCQCENYAFMVMLICVCGHVFTCVHV